MFGSISSEFIILAIHTVLFWLIVVILHKLRTRLTLIPLYAILGALVVYTHTLSSYSISVSQWGLYFLVSSTAYFTPLLLILLLVYLFDGARAARKGLEVVIGVSLLQVFVVYITSFEDYGHFFIPANSQNFINYFWSTTAMIIDIAAMGIIWEIIGKIKALKLTARITLLLFLVFMIDAFVFVTGVFGNSPEYFNIILTDTIVRIGLSILMGFVIADYLRASDFSEETRERPKKIWEIINFRSALEEEVSSLQAEIEKRRQLEKELFESKELYKLALEGTSAGIWDYDIKRGVETWSMRFYELLGYSPGNIKPSFAVFQKMLHPDDADIIVRLLDINFANSSPFSAECRIKLKTGEYHWFLLSGKKEYLDDRPVRMVISVIDIHDKKEAESKLSKKLTEAEETNKIMIDRELKMAELKKEIDSLKKFVSKSKQSSRA